MWCSKMCYPEEKCIYISLTQNGCFCLPQAFSFFISSAPQIYSFSSIEFRFRLHALIFIPNKTWSLAKLFLTQKLSFDDQEVTLEDY